MWFMYAFCDGSDVSDEFFYTELTMTSPRSDDNLTKKPNTGMENPFF